MKKTLLVLLLVPMLSSAQSKKYFSADASANFGKFLEHTGFGANISGNIKVFERVYVGLSTGVVQVKPFIKNMAVPLSGRLTFFTSNQEEGVAPFGLFELGKLFYKEENFGGSASQTMEGDLSFFAGVGVQLVSNKKLHPFFAIGYAGYYYNNNHYDSENSLDFSKPYNYRRMAIKVGLMLPK